MKVTRTISSASELRDYFLDNSWGGARNRVDAIESREDYMQVWEKIFDYIDECMEELDEVGMNDVLWFDDFIQEIIYNEEDEEDEDEEEDE